MDKIKVTIEEVIYENPANGYSVVDCSSDGNLLTLTGYMPGVAPGENVLAYGEWTTHPEYGEQFKVEYYEKIMPTEERDIERYLSSGVLPHIGKSTAAKIVEKFGVDAFDIIEHNHLRLTEISGISQRKADEIYKAYVEQVGVKELVMLFQKFGLSPAYAVKAYKKLGAGAKNLILENPYILSDCINGITFQTADKIGTEMGIPKESPKRIYSGIRSIMMNCAYNGHTFVPLSSIVAMTKANLEIDGGVAEDAVSDLIFKGVLIKEDFGDFEGIYLESYYNAERYVAKRLRELSGVCFEMNPDEVEELIDKTEKSQGIDFAESQRDAIRQSFYNSAMVITGGPGTGKTTIINSIIKIMKSLGKKVALAAPTGRAAKRMSEVSGEEAKTIHRLLENMPEGDEVNLFARNEHNRLDCDVLIVDEMSMVDITLMDSLLKAFPVGARLIMVGDADQLPSVGAGNVLRDIIESDSLVCIKLKEIFRQAKESMIIVNAHRINNGEFPYLNDKDNDFFLVSRETPEETCSAIVDLCANRIPKSYGVDSMSQIQVLTPTRKTAIGVQYLNALLQDALNPRRASAVEKKTASCTFRVGDKVMQIKNNYTIEWEKEDGEKGTGVFNGDVGFITFIDNRNKKVTVQYEEKTVNYDFIQLEELELAYAVTVHKSQGSEFDVIIIPMLETHRLLMTRNLLYTAVTRAKRLVILVGREEIIGEYIRNDNIQRRYSGLKDKLSFS
ncbi:MAG: ATP-dependent RecD-like DNA helicase [Clostridia bacterium]|nr:ATP-dependent RecD-like DNA helicase [Clostridia bacterium]